MKKCHFCNTLNNDDSLFCVECGKPIPQGNVCSYCGAAINEGDTFCENCGKKIDEVLTTEEEPSKEKPKCPHCGAAVNEGDAFCESCGKSLSISPIIKDKKSEQQNKCPHCGAEVIEGDEFCNTCGKPIRSNEFIQRDVDSKASNPSEEISEYEYESKNGNLPLIIGAIFVILLLGGAWWYWDSSNKRAARERQIADSLEIARIDSIKNAEIKEKQRQDSIKLADEEAKKNFLRDSYANILDAQMNKDDSGEYWGEYYFLYDLNGDNIPELWLQATDNEGCSLIVYTVHNEECIRIFKSEVGHPYHHSFYKGVGYILMNSAHMGSQTWTTFSLESGKVVEKETFTLEHDDSESYTEVEYKNPTEPEVETYELTNREPIMQIEI